MQGYRARGCSLLERRVIGLWSARLQGCRVQGCMVAGCGGPDCLVEAAGCQDVVTQAWFNLKYLVSECGGLGCSFLAAWSGCGGLGRLVSGCVSPGCLTSGFGGLGCLLGAAWCQYVAVRLIG